MQVAAEATVGRCKPKLPEGHLKWTVGSIAGANRAPMRMQAGCHAVSAHPRSSAPAHLPLLQVDIHMAPTLQGAGWERPPLRLQFEVPGLTVSGVRIT